MNFGKRVEHIVSRIPNGNIATYGQIASLASTPRAARAVGWILRHSRRDIPWHRVVNKNGRISIIHETLTPRVQANLLRNEGVTVERRDEEYRVDIKRYLWNPVSSNAGIV